MVSGVSSSLVGLHRVGSREADDLLAESGFQGQLALRGGPVLALPAHVREAAIAALSEPDRRTSRGLLELREAIAAVLGADAGIEVDPEQELLVTNGAMQGLATVFRTLLDQGDEVIIPTPNFFFDGSVRLAGGTPIYVECREEDGWSWEIERIEAAVTGRTRVIIVCNPTNPTGFLPMREQLAWIVAIARNQDLIVVSDESYHHSAYDGRPFVSIASFCDDADRLVTIRSLSKSHSLAGWRMGYVHASPGLTAEFSRVFEWECLHCAYVPQRVATAALTGPQDWLQGVNDEYQGIRDRLMIAISQSEWLSCVEPEAGPFLFPNLLRAEEATGADAYAQLLEVGIHTVPGRYFHSTGHVRLPFGAAPETVSRLAALLEGFTPNTGRRLDP
jgi:aminotransferase